MPYTCHFHGHQQQAKERNQSEKKFSISNDKEKSAHLKLTRGSLDMNEEGITSSCDFLALLVHRDNGEGNFIIQFRGGSGLSLEIAVPASGRFPLTPPNSFITLLREGRLASAYLRVAS